MDAFICRWSTQVVTWADARRYTFHAIRFSALEEHHTTYQEHLARYLKKIWQRIRNIWQVTWRSCFNVLISNVLKVTWRICYNVSGTSCKLLDEDVTTYQERLASYLPSKANLCWTGVQQGCRADGQWKWETASVSTFNMHILETSLTVYDIHS